VVSFARPVTRLSILAATLFVTVQSVAFGARADGPLDGAWQAGPTRIEVSVTSWGGDCGPRPQSVTSRGGGRVQISQDGDHLVFRGSRTNRTDQCWSENSAVRRVSTTAQAGQWRTVCRTPAGDSRGETGTYVVRLSNPTTLDFRDVSEYDWQLNASHCLATITTTQSFSHSQTPTNPEPTPQPQPQTPPEPPANTACTPGAAARLNLYPASATVAPGGRVCFRARVVDARNCVVPSQSVAWSLDRAAGVRGELRDGCVSAGEGEGADGELRVTATSGALRDVATVRVHTADLSDLIARRGETGLVETDSQPAAPVPTAGENTQLAARTTVQASTTTVWVLIFAASGLGVACLLLFLVLRKRRSAAGADSFAHTIPTEPGAGDWGTASSETPTPSTPPTENMICPVCRRGYAPGGITCESDGATLLPYSVFTAQAKALEAAQLKSKLCPTCGERYSIETVFCGKDGTTLIAPK
jgi:hypothetical protein